VNGDAALGLLEVYGLAAAVAVADEMAKAAPIEILRRLDIGDGLVTVVASGGVSAVLEAIDAGRRLAASRDSFRAAVVLGRPAAGVSDLFFPPGEGGAAPPGGSMSPRVAVNRVRARRSRPGSNQTPAGGKAGG
jgi:ethanolamine utilization protein EutM